LKKRQKEWGQLHAQPQDGRDRLAGTRAVFVLLYFVIHKVRFRSERSLISQNFQERWKFSWILSLFSWYSVSFLAIF
jgi:hypothetical protein